MSDAELHEDNTDLIGSTSADGSSPEAEKKGFLASITVFESMLVISFFFIALATILLFTVLRQYSENFPFGGGMPYSTADVQFLMW